MHSLLNSIFEFSESFPWKTPLKSEMIESTLNAKELNDLSAART